MSADIPQIWRQVSNPQLVIKTPFRQGQPSARYWLNQALPARANRVDYIGNGQWTVSRRHLDAMIRACIAEFGSVKLIWDANSQEKCTVQCQHASPDTVADCECVCGGDFHGGGEGGRWKNVAGDLLVANSVLRRVTVIENEEPQRAPSSARVDYNPASGRRWQSLFDEMNSL